MAGRADHGRGRCEHADVIEVTALLDLTTWPDAMRVIVRREWPPPGANCPARGTRRLPVPFATNTSVLGTAPIAFLEARHRARARVEMGSGTPRTPSRPGFPSREYVINTARLQPVAIAADLTAWLLLRDFTQSLRGCEPKALRPRLLHVPALNRSGRR